MSIQKTLGGDRLGSGKKMKVELHGYERSTHDLSYLWKSTQAPGTLVPFMKQVALPGDTFDIDLDCNILTLPTIGPLFGSFKVQLDMFLTPIRLYNALLHNNKLEVGRDMSKVKLPIIEWTARPFDPDLNHDKDNWQVNPSSLPAYLGMRGIGDPITGTPTRKLQCVPILIYWDIYKNYYANKQEEIGAVLHTPSISSNPVDDIKNSVGDILPELPTEGVMNIGGMDSYSLIVDYSSGAPDPKTIFILYDRGGTRDSVSLYDLCGGNIVDDGVSKLTGQILPSYLTFGVFLINWSFANPFPGQGKPKVATFPLVNIDSVRENLLKDNSYTPVSLNTIAASTPPYQWLWEQPSGIPNILSSQEGLGLKTYQSDLFNNWLQTEWIDGSTGVNEVSKIDVTSGFLKIDQLNLAKKVYDVLNRIAVSGGSYKDWLDVTFDHVMPWIPLSPMYMGGLSKELVFQAVISNASTGNGTQPLGTLAGRGVLSGKHKGGKCVIKVDEPSYIMGIVSLTPRLDYSQGNDWDIYAIQTFNDFHIPGFDQIGFQELIEEQMHWATTQWASGPSKWLTQSAGKQPAWVNYMTNVNKSLGNFAIANNSMFMTLNRRYSVTIASDGTTIDDVTTYIDPSKYNNIFAETSLDAQNFWVQIACNITARRKMSAKIMPNV